MQDVMKKFEVTTDHLVLLKNMYVSWWSCETGAPCIDPKYPYGDYEVAFSIAKLLGWEFDKYDLYESLEGEQLRQKAMNLHVEMETVLQILLVHAGEGIRVGMYQLDGYGIDWKRNEKC